MTDPTPETTPTRDEAVPTGWKLVPVEPTEEMIEAMCDAYRQARRSGVSGMTLDAQFRAEFAQWFAAYSAMLASAPAPASGGVDAVAVKEALRWVDDNLSAAKSVMKKSAEAGNGYANFAAHDAHKHLTTIRSALSPAATPVSEAGGEHDARLSEHPAFQAPAGMPGVEEIARVIFSGKLMQPANGPWRDDVMTVGQKFCLYAARDVLSLFAPILAETERATVKRIAQVASEVAAQAGVGASETAGLIVSVLAANPEQTERFMAEGSELFIDGTIRPENGCLTHMAMNGQVVSPTRLRMMKGQSQ